MTSFRWQAIWAKIISPGAKLTALACHLTKKVDKAEELAKSLSPNIVSTWRDRVTESTKVELTSFQINESLVTL